MHQSLASTPLLGASSPLMQNSPPQLTTSPLLFGGRTAAVSSDVDSSAKQPTLLLGTSRCESPVSRTAMRAAQPPPPSVSAVAGTTAALLHGSPVQASFGQVAAPVSRNSVRSRSCRSPTRRTAMVVSASQYGTGAGGGGWLLAMPRSASARDSLPSTARSPSVTRRTPSHAASGGPTLPPQTGPPSFQPPLVVVASSAPGAVRYTRGSTAPAVAPAAVAAPPTGLPVAAPPTGQPTRAHLEQFMQTAALRSSSPMLFTTARRDCGSATATPQRRR